MRHPDEFIIEDVRCFKGEQRATIRPITLLVGENSTGKTSFLGCYRALHGMFSAKSSFHEMLPVRHPYRDTRCDFNLEPFQMGAFRNIVRSGRGKSDLFKLGFQVCADMAKYDMSLSFVEKGSEPIISSLRYQFSEKSFLEIKRGAHGNCVLEIPDSKTETNIPFHHLFYLIDTLSKNMSVERVNKDLNLVMEELGTEYKGEENITQIAKFLFDQFSAAHQEHRLPSVEIIPTLPPQVPIAPLRSQPKRTYDPVSETTSPDGKHTPMLMMHLYRTDKPHWEPLHGDLRNFGKESGLFSDIKIKSHGKQMSDPFQLQVKVKTGPFANIMDVGYGVSQTLPILVDIMSRTETTFLLQQPEVHLHPRGQAELASFLVKSSRERNHSFLIETHSDHMVDRVRIAVREKIIKPNDVSILYFAPKGSAVKIHSIELDKRGNICNAPNGYRDFFRQETDAILGFED